MVGLALPRGASTPAAASEEVCIRSNFAHAAADRAGLVGAVPPLVAGAVQQQIVEEPPSDAALRGWNLTWTAVRRGFNNDSSTRVEGQLPSP